MIAAAFTNAGFLSRAFDIQRCSEHDFTSPIGIVLGMISVLQLVVGSPLHSGTVCTSFCWINSGTHKRTAALPLGQTEHKYVEIGNTLAAVTVASLKVISHMTVIRLCGQIFFWL